MNSFKRCIARVLAVCMIGIGMPLPASAGIVATDQVQRASAERDRIKGFLERADVRARMEALGVNADAARARVDALTDREAADLAAKIDSAPAGGDAGVLEVLLIVFLVLLITDILGYTKIFPFTKPIK
ncbi:MAG: PA2779 family protein [Burkholderiales bacterium]